MTPTRTSTATAVGVGAGVGEGVGVGVGAGVEIKLVDDARERDDDVVRHAVGWEFSVYGFLGVGTWKG